MSSMTKEYHQAWRAANRERVRESHRRWRKANPGKWRVTRRNAEWRYRLRHMYGITPERYEEVLTAQEGLCRICKGVPKAGRRLAVDHNHATGEFRGLLCDRCNNAIGLLGDDPAMLLRTTQYVLLNGNLQ